MEVMEKKHQVHSSTRYNTRSTSISNKITPPRIYEKGIYSLRKTQSGDRFLRYSPDDGSVTSLKTPSSCLPRVGKRKLIQNNNDIYIVGINRASDTWNIKMEKYDVKTDAWKSTASTPTENFRVVISMYVSYCQDKVFVFVMGMPSSNTWKYTELCMMYCLNTNTWRRLHQLEGHRVTSVTACGDSIYMTSGDYQMFLRYLPSTDQLLDICCKYNMKFVSATAYKSKIFFLMDQYKMKSTIVMFNTDTIAFQSFVVNGMSIHNGITFAFSKEAVYFFCKEKVMKLDLSFIDEMVEPQLIQLPDKTK